LVNKAKCQFDYLPKIKFVSWQTFEFDYKVHAVGVKNANEMSSKLFNSLDSYNKCTVIKMGAKIH